jgi:hypothetical protein
MIDGKPSDWGCRLPLAWRRPILYSRSRNRRPQRVSCICLHDAPIYHQESISSAQPEPGSEQQGAEQLSVAFPWLYLVVVREFDRSLVDHL